MKETLQNKTLFLGIIPRKNQHILLGRFTYATIRCVKDAKMQHRRKESLEWTLLAHQEVACTMKYTVYVPDRISNTQNLIQLFSGP